MKLLFNDFVILAFEAVEVSQEEAHVCAVIHMS